MLQEQLYFMTWLSSHHTNCQQPQDISVPGSCKVGISWPLCSSYHWLLTQQNNRCRPWCFPSNFLPASKRTVRELTRRLGCCPDSFEEGLALVAIQVITKRFSAHQQWHRSVDESCPFVDKNFPKIYITIRQLEAVWFYSRKQTKGYTHQANILPDLTSPSLHTLLVNRGDGCFWL